MTDQEFTSEIRRGLITIMRAVIRKYGLAWADFLPREDRYILPVRPTENQTLSKPVVVLIDPGA